MYLPQDRATAQVTNKQFLKAHRNRNTHAPEVFLDHGISPVAHAPAEGLQYESEESKMSTLGNPIEDHVLGDSAQEQECLKLQDRILEKWTEQFLFSAGLKPGTRGWT
jgi:hypothetical protein